MSVVPHRKIIVNLATSADGYVARPNGDLDWLTERPAPKGFYGLPLSQATFGACRAVRGDAVFCGVLMNQRAFQHDHTRSRAATKDLP